MKSKYLRILLFAIVSAFLLSACGGGGSGSNSSPPTSTAKAEGVYQGTTSAGKTFSALVLEDDTFWDLYGIVSGGVFYVQGIATGQGTSNNGSYSASFSDYPAPGATAYSGTLSGSYVAGSSLSGSLTESGTSGTFTGSAPTNSTYNYSAAAHIATVQGTWSGSFLDGETGSVAIASDGTFSGTSSLGCTFSGTLVPRASGKNVFNVNLTMGGSPCYAANQSASGIGIAYALSNGQTQFVLGAVTASRTAASVFVAAR